MNTQEKIGVLLLNLGGPERPEDVRPFLLNLFSDRDIIRLGPPFMQKIIARIIATRRAPKSRANYAKIGGGSPIRAKTEEQARALEDALTPAGSFIVRSCMRYWHPFAGEALAQMREAGVDRLIALPLYPHYSIATTGSSVTDLKAQMNRMQLQLPLEVIEAWPEQTEFIAALATRITEGIASFAGAEVELVYSAHSLPVQFIEEGDPYVEHLKQTIAALEAQTKVQGRLCYQSRSGPVQWLGPALPEVIEAIATQGGKNILVVPISFVSDHVETLYEIDIEYRQLAENLGMGFRLTRALNADPQFIASLAALVREKCA
ncbi:ferrochelatase [Desulfobulbus rhabdoformis]|uniref:ferrochelatase n=1 Tax=Desulfobulbus rhabdoformis TaxID=34032 RepID=UPI001964F287|nr:ferrochelatase [Desulfobulbus rhabdoformis]MBM9613349.1 ferrochelatase [Desulfobulbus rhabdoformis]